MPQEGYQETISAEDFMAELMNCTSMEAYKNTASAYAIQPIDAYQAMLARFVELKTRIEGLEKRVDRLERQRQNALVLDIKDAAEVVVRDATEIIVRI
jgi:hypothetical protein